MIRQFIFAKLIEKFLKKVLRGDMRGIIKYLKIAIATAIILLFLFIVGIFLLVQFLFGLMSQS